VDSFVHWLSEIIERGRRQDGIAAGDPATSARTFSGCVAGLALQWHAIGLSQEDARRPEAVPLLMRGLREQGP